MNYRCIFFIEEAGWEEESVACGLCLAPSSCLCNSSRRHAGSSDAGF